MKRLTSPLGWNFVTESRNQASMALKSAVLETATFASTMVELAHFPNASLINKISLLITWSALASGDSMSFIRH